MIETKDLTFTYPAPEGETNPPALNGVSVEIEKGSFVVVLGHNGSGKSTLAKHMNAVLLPGGGDIEPSLFGQERIPACGEPNPLRDAAEPKLLHAFLAAGKPILGICRGIQVLNAFLGGELYQDIKPLEHVPHNDHWAKIHTVTVRRGTLLAEILKQDTVLVNSQHHQAVDKVAPGLVLSALSEDGIVEGIEKPDAKFCLGVQWHPEWLSAADPAMQGIFDAFVAACK